MTSGPVLVGLVAAVAVLAASRSVAVVVVGRAVRRAGAVARCRPSPGPLRVQQITVVDRLRRSIDGAGLSVPTERALLVWFGGVAAAMIVGFAVGGAALGFLGVALAIGAGPVVLAVAHHRRRVLAERCLPLLLDVVARDLRAGRSLRESVEDAADTLRASALGPELVPLRSRLRAGGPLVEVLDGWALDATSSARRSSATALALAAETGAAPAVLIDAVAESVRDRLAVGREARALATQARTSAGVVAAAPLAFTAITGVADPRTLQFLVGSPVGIACLVAGLVTEAVGVAWMARLVGRHRS